MTILNRYTFNNKDDQNGWELLAQAQGQLGNRDQELAARAEGLALAGRLDQAISLLSSASSQVKLGSLQQAATTRASTSCAACNNALNRTRRCNKGEVMTDAVKFTITLAAPRAATPSAC